MHDHHHSESGHLKVLLPIIISFVLLLAGILFDTFHLPFFTSGFRLGWYLLAYLPVGYPVIKESVEYILKGDVFTEFFLMSLATICALAIGEYPEAVAVMLFYGIGEFFQGLAVKKAQKNIKELIDERPDTVTILEDGQFKEVKAIEVSPGKEIHLKPGEKLALDGELVSDRASFNTAALTGESKPDAKYKGETVLAGMINLNVPAVIKTTARYEDSKLSKILELVQHASEQKSPTELFIRKFAYYYTPAVVIVAVLITFLPYFFVDDYLFRDWLYRALVFLVISCPCALVISVPLSYFGGVGAASRKGILFKGSNYLDLMASVKHLVMDKTGTLTEGVFQVKEVVLEDGFREEELLPWLNILESFSTHPVATAVAEYVGTPDKQLAVKDVEELPGRGLRGNIAGKDLLAGNGTLMDEYGIAHSIRPEDAHDTVILLAVDGRFAGYLSIADKIKEDAREAIDSLKELGLKTTMLSGDKPSVVQHVAGLLGIDQAFGGLLPEDKVAKVQEIKAQGESVAFVGDGVNDAPVIALSDAGIAMGGLGSDAAIEIADIVIQNDQPSKLPVAIRIGRATRSVVWQNVFFAFGVKLIVLCMGAGGIASMWEAVFADVGVTLLAVLNAMRLQRMKF